MKYKKSAISFRKQEFVTGILSVILLTGIIVFAFIFSTTDVNTESFASKDELKVDQKNDKDTSSSSTEQSPTELKNAAVATTETPSENNVVEETAPAVEAEQYDTNTVNNYSEAATPVAVAPTYHSNSAQVNTTALGNGNTAGQVGSEAAAQMAAATGVPQSTWESIIARESNGNPNVSNASGASGLFQTMPGWGSTATVQDQVNAAINAYNAQGLSAWGY